MKFIFLDVDGVLNGHDKQSNGYCGISPKSMNWFNYVLRITKPAIVLTSSWRYLVHEGGMNVVGLRNLFLTHGMECLETKFFVTERDVEGVSRGEQITNFIRYNITDHFHYVVLDNDDFGIREAGHDFHFIQTGYSIGLTHYLANRAIEVLKIQCQPSLVLRYVPQPEETKSPSTF